MRVHAKDLGSCRRTVCLKLALALAALAVFGSAERAQAIACGDVLGPGGFEVLSGDLLCEESPALIVAGPVSVDLNGFTVSCSLAEDGTLAGTGIRLIGQRCELRNGTIQNCGRGVVVEGDGGHRLERLTVTSPEVDGDGGIAFQVKTSRSRFLHNIVRDYAGEGFRLGDSDVPADLNVLQFNKATANANHGFRVRRGERNLLLLNHAESNTGEGFRSQDQGNRLIANTAKGNTDEGIRLRDEAAQGNFVFGNYIEGNGLDPCDPFPPVEDANPGIAITNQATGNDVINNRVARNCIGIGIEEGSSSNTIVLNVARGNNLVDMADANPDCDDNEWLGNRFGTSIAGPLPGEPAPACIQ